MPKGEQFVRPGSEDPRIIGPYWDYVQEQAEEAHREAHRAAPVGHRFAHERTWEWAEFSKVIKEHNVPPALAGAMVRCFYIGRESSERDRPGADRIRKTALHSLAARFRAAITNALENELNHGEQNDDA